MFWGDRPGWPAVTVRARCSWPLSCNVRSPWRIALGPREIQYHDANPPWSSDKSCCCRLYCEHTHLDDFNLCRLWLGVVGHVTAAVSGAARVSVQADG
jgi:hypothetical protein